jgi:regulator of protease activity HflC (stomatin/prohibitin superfamily)
MILIIVSLILTIVTALIIYIAHVENDVSLKYMPVSLGWLLLIIFGCFSSIKTGEVGIKTKFGKITDTYLSEGINFKMPYEKIEKVNIKVQKYENKEELSTSTKDMQIVNNIKVTINYQVNGKEAVNLYKRVGNNYKQTILEPAIQETVKATISKYTSEELVTKRSEISLDINNTLNDRIKGYGINSVSVAINNFDFSQSYNDAIEKKAVAEQEVATAKNQQQKAKIEAETKIIKAKSEAEANKNLEKSLSPEILQQKFIEKWNGQLPTVTSGNSFLDVSKYLK